MGRDVNDLRVLQALPLSVKILLTKRRIRDWVNEYGIDGVYVSFSGGKDSTVLLTIAREMYPDVKAVFVDTGLEYPEIRDFVRTWSNVEWIRPKMTFRQVIEKYGYPLVNRFQSVCKNGEIPFKKGMTLQRLVPIKSFMEQAITSGVTVQNR